MISLHFRALDDLEGWTEEFETVEEAVLTFNIKWVLAMILVHHML